MYYCYYFHTLHVKLFILKLTLCYVMKRNERGRPGIKEGKARNKNNNIGRGSPCSLRTAGQTKVAMYAQHGEVVRAHTTHNYTWTSEILLGKGSAGQVYVGYRKVSRLLLVMRLGRMCVALIFRNRQRRLPSKYCKISSPCRGRWKRYINFRGTKTSSLSLTLRESVR